jgi:hypothetical protein
MSLKSGRLPTSFIFSSLEDNHLLLGRMPRKIIKLAYLCINGCKQHSINHLKKNNIQ